MKRLALFIILASLTIIACNSESIDVTNNPELETGTYFPPLNSDTWTTKTASDLGWNQDNLQLLLDFLEDNNTKSFMILHDGKIVVEAYMNGHDTNKAWYWASAGKTLTTAITGIAQHEGFLDINNPVTDYLGSGWTSVTTDKETLITCKHLLSMTSGLDDNLGDSVSPENLLYVADAGARWAYHNVYKKMQDVVASATESSFTNYFNAKLKNKIGMTGAWLETNDFNIYWSKTRSMARFGLLIYSKGKWNDEQIIPETFLNEATNTTQNINKAYGYLWWLNGKDSFHLPGSQLEYSGKLIPNAPDGMFAALGKNDQKIYVVPSKKLVIVRMGNEANSEALALSSFDNELWEKINDVMD